MKEYRFDTAYTKENIKILTNIQFQTYKWKVQAAVFLTGVFLIGIAAFGVHSQKWSLLLLIFWLLVMCKSFLSIRLSNKADLYADAG